jgi:3-oxosteroid 1-dehydrogenase
MAEWDRTVDLLVMGSGAAGMMGAIRAHDLGLDVLLVEKSDLFGGNTAMSGGVCWVPNNPGMTEEGLEDSDEDGFEYLKHITKGEVPDERLWLYIRESKRVLAYLQENTHVRYVSLTKYTDYYPEAPGGRSGGRSMDPVPFDGAKLQEHLILLRRPHPQSQILGKFGITAREAQAAIGVGFRTMLFMAWQMFLYLLRYPKRKRWGRDTKLCAGNSLMGRLLLSLKERNIPAWLNTTVEDLILEKGSVTGAIVDREGEKLRIKCTRGVLIAAGGFSRNLEMRRKYQRHPISPDWTAGSPSNTGDGILLGEKAGGALGLMDEAWWTPVSLVPKSPFSWVLVVEKSLPHGLFVNQDGKRFTNEAAPYIDVVNGMYEDVAATQTADPRWYHIFDATYRKSSIEGPIAPGKVMPDSQVPRRYRDGKYLFRADTLKELAEQIGVPADSLTSTIARFNENAIKGEDPDYNRGWSAQDRYYGDPRVKPNCSLGPIENAPFYAVRVYPGDLGTKGGLLTDERSRVLNIDGQPIVGLYAAGNATASMMGRTYPGAGGTIGPALTFGFFAAEAAAATSPPSAEVHRDSKQLGLAESAS